VLDGRPERPGARRREAAIVPVVAAVACRIVWRAWRAIRPVRVKPSVPPPRERRAGLECPRCSHWLLVARQPSEPAGLYLRLCSWRSASSCPCPSFRIPNGHCHWLLLARQPPDLAGWYLRLCSWRSASWCPIFRIPNGHCRFRTCRQSLSRITTTATSRQSVTGRPAPWQTPCVSATAFP